MKRIRLKRGVLSVIAVVMLLLTTVNLAIAVTKSPDFSEDYKKTSDLTGSDVADNYQKNYQESTGKKGSYLTKSAEWVDKENGEALITIKASQSSTQETTAVYVATLCYAHGLTEDILVKNLVTLTQSYDNVDFIAIYNTYESGIAETKRFKSDATEEEIRTYVRQTKVDGGNEYPHYICSIPFAIQKYLFGNGGDSYISKENLVHDPTAIYVSCDSMYLTNPGTSEAWGIDYSTEKYYNFLTENYGDRYFSMSQTSKQHANPDMIIRFSNVHKYNSTIMNTVIGVLHPQNYGQADLVLSQDSIATWNASTIEAINLPYTDKKYAADYSYDKDFEEAGVVIISNCTIVDTVVNEFEILDVNVTTDLGRTLTSKIDEQRITVSDSTYTSGEEIVLKIRIKLKSDVIKNFEEFSNTNVGSATIKSDLSDEVISVESPKLIPVTNNYKVNYIDKYTNQTISTQKIENDVALNTQVRAIDEAINIPEYTYIDSDKEVLTIGEDELQNILNLYYAKNTNLTVNYIDKATDEIMETYTEDGYEGKDYTTDARTFNKYTLVEEPSNKNGKIQRDGTIVNYYYLYNSNLIIKYIDEIDNKEIIPEVKANMKEGEKYTTTPREFENYALTSIPANQNGTIGKNDITVIYKYKKISAGVEIKYIDKKTGQTISDTLYREGNEKDRYTSSALEIDGYELVKMPDNANGEMTVEKTTVIYEYIKTSYVTTRYLDENNGRILHPSNVEKYKEGEDYSTVKENILGYTYTRVENDPSGIVQRDNITVTYYYKKNTSVIVKYVDMLDNNKEIATTITINGLQGQDYTTQKKEIDGYIYVDVIGKTEGQMEYEPLTITYRYKKSVILTIIHIDKNAGKTIIPNIQTIYKEGDTYTATAQNIPGYVLIESPESTTGVMGRDNIEKTFYYKKISGGLVVNYVDRITNELLSQEVYKGNENDKVSLDLKSFIGYILDEAPTFDEVTLEETPKQITYYYRKNGKIDIIGIDKDTGERLYLTEKTGIEGDKYKTTPKNIEGYELVSIPTNEEGVFDRNNTTVIYEYKKKTGKVTVKYIDKDTNEELDEDIIVKNKGEEYSTSKKEFKDYNFVEVIGEEKGIVTENKFVTYYYEKKIGKVQVIYEDIYGKEIKREEVQDKVGKDYEVIIEEIPDYEVVETIGNTCGQYIDGTIQIKIILEKIDVKPIEKDKGTIVVKFLDEDGNKLREDYDRVGYVGNEFYIDIQDIDGYELIGDKYIRTIYENGQLVFEVIYRKIPSDIPDTGDMNLALYIVIGISSAFIISKKIIK